MAILTRIIQIVKADVHAVMDQLEDQGILLKQHLRDMEESLSQKETRLKKMMLSRSQVQQEYEKYSKESSKLEQDLEVAIKKERDDIARMLIKKLKPLTHILKERQYQTEVLDQEISQFKESLDRQRLQYEHLKHKAADYFQGAAQYLGEKPLSTSTPTSIYQALSEEEVELELLQRNEALKGGAVT
jgi:phage shock protein A